MHGKARPKKSKKEDKGDEKEKEKGKGKADDKTKRFKGKSRSSGKKANQAIADGNSSSEPDNQHSDSSLSAYLAAHIPTPASDGS